MAKKFTFEKVAASIFGIFGMSLIAMSLKITGAVIGVQNNISSRIIGISLIVLAVFIFFFPSKKKFKKHK